MDDKTRLKIARERLENHKTAISRMSEKIEFQKHLVEVIEEEIKDLEGKMYHDCWIFSGERFEKFSCYSVGKYLYTSFESGGGREREMKVQFCPICGMKAEEF